MYKDPNKQREANAERQRRYRTKRDKHGVPKGVTTRRRRKGVTKGSTTQGVTGEGVTTQHPRIMGMTKSGLCMPKPITPNGLGTAKRGKDIKSFVA